MAGVVRLSQAAHHALGKPAARELEAGFDHVVAVSEETHRKWIDLIVDRRVSDVRASLSVSLKELEVQLRQELGGLEVRLREEIAGLRSEVRAGRAETESRLLKWMFLFWVSTIGLSLLSKI